MVLESEDSHLQLKAVEALRAIGPYAADATPVLIEVLEKSFGEWEEPRAVLVRDATIQALGDIGPGAIEAVPALIKCYDRSTNHRENPTTKALESITHQDFGRDPVAWQQWWEKQGH